MKDAQKLTPSAFVDLAKLLNINFLNRNIQYMQYQVADPICTTNFSQMREFYGSADFIFYNELKVFPLCYFEDADSIYFSQSMCFWHKGKWKNQPCVLYGMDIDEVINWKWEE